MRQLADDRIVEFGGGWKSSSKSLFVFGFDFWKTQLSPTQLGSMQEYPETHAPQKHYTLLLKPKAGSFFFCLVDDL